MANPRNTIVIITACLATCAFAGQWSEWSGTDFDGNLNQEQMCNPGEKVVIQQWMEQGSYGLVNMQFICSDNLRHRMNTNEDGEWNKELDCPEGFNQAIGREQGGYGLVNVAVACLGSNDFTYSNQNFDGRDDLPLACPAGTKFITGFQTQEQGGYGLVNFRFYCE